MCLFGRSKPDWEEDVVFANRRNSHHHRRSRPHSRVVSETVIRQHHSPRPSVQFIEAPPPPPPPRTPTPVYTKPATPPAPIIVPSPPSPRLELVSVEEDTRRPSRGGGSVTVSVAKKSRRGSRSERGDDVYIEREREIIMKPAPPPPPPQPEFETFRYVKGAGHMEQVGGGPPVVQEKVERVVERERERDRRRSRSITYESNPRASGRLVERERVVIEDGVAGEGRRREYYRRP